jgi:glycosyltransferase involved in cell wall biosynthesis
MQVSVVVIARDAQDHLPNCLSSIAFLTNDIVVVVDKRTTDNTYQIAKNFSAKVAVRDFNDFSSQKNFADSLAAHPWILSLDADEVASEALVKAIQILPATPLYSAYSIPRYNLIFNKYIKYTNWDPHGLIRLFNKNYCQWVGEVHETITTAGEVGRLLDPILHNNYDSAEQFVARQNIYSSMEADRLFRQGTRFSPMLLCFQPIYDFFRRFILHTGFLDGWHGLYLSYLMAIYHISIWVKLWQKYQKNSA